MEDTSKLSQDQLERIEATLQRIRAGLSESTPTSFEEPGHIFEPEAFHATD